MNSMGEAAIPAEQHGISKTSTANDCTCTKRQSIAVTVDLPGLYGAAPSDNPTPWSASACAVRPTELGQQRELRRHEQRGSELRRHEPHDKCQRTRGPRPSRRRIGNGCASRQEGTIVNLPENQQPTSTSRTHHRQVQVCRQLVGSPKADEPKVGRMPTVKTSVSAGFSKKTSSSPP